MRRGYLEELAQLQRRFSRMLEEVMLGSGLSIDDAQPGTWQPPVDVVQMGQGYRVSVELPGVQREDIELQAKDRRLEISGRRRPPGGDSRYHRLEGLYGPFRRTIDVGAAIVGDSITATLESGVLTVDLTTRSPSRRIPVEDGGRDE